MTSSHETDTQFTLHKDAQEILKDTEHVSISSLAPLSENS